MSDRPQLRDMAVALAGLTWDEVTLMAIQLRVDMPTLIHIEAQYNDLRVRMVHSMNSWLDSDPQASWSKIVAALRTINKLTVARAVEQQYCQSMETTVSPASQPPTGPHSPPPTESVTTSAEQPSPPSDCTTAPTNSVVSTTSSLLALCPRLIRHQEHASPSPSPSPTSSTYVSRSSSSSASLVDYPISEATQPMHLPGAPNRVVTEPEKARIKQVTSWLQDKFVAVLTHTKILFTKKESQSDEFLSELRITLTTLPLSNKFKHLLFLQNEQKRIEDANDIHEIFKILDSHWNWSDYYLLQRLITDFGDDSLKEDMSKYMAELEQFEKATTIQHFCNAVESWDRHWNCPLNFSKAVLKLQKDAAECTLYDLRKLKEAIASESSVKECALFFRDVHASAVVMEIALPKDALEPILAALDPAFLEQHQIASVTIDKKPLGEYDKEYLKVSYCGPTHACSVNKYCTSTWDKQLHVHVCGIQLDKANRGVVVTSMGHTARLLPTQATVGHV